MDSKSTLSAIDKISPFLEIVRGAFVIYAAPNQNIAFSSNGKKFIYYLIDGEIDIYRQVDDILLLTMQAPKILGLSILDSENCFHYIKTTKNSKLMAFEQQNFVDIVNDNNLWKDVFTITSSLMKSYFIRDEMFCSKGVYGVIKHNLEALWNYPPAKRERTSIFKYILSRSDISRSSLSKILKDLSDGGYISINRGKLLDMKNLPAKY